MYNGAPVDWFDKDTYDYTVDLDYNTASFTYTTNSLAEVYEFFDEESLTLSVVVIGGDMDYSNMNEYRIHFTSSSENKNYNENGHITQVEDHPFSGRLAEEPAFALYTLNGIQVRSGVSGDDSMATKGLPRGVYVIRRGNHYRKIVVDPGK